MRAQAGPAFRAAGAHGTVAIPRPCPIRNPRLHQRRRTVPILADLNPAQRAAVEFGVAPARAGQGGGEDGPLLVIAGAGSGKTNTLAHRVAHLILNGADPQRMLLLTFSRRAALKWSAAWARCCTG